MKPKANYNENQVRNIILNHVIQYKSENEQGKKTVSATTKQKVLMISRTQAAKVGYQKPNNDQRLLSKTSQMIYKHKLSRAELDITTKKNYMRTGH